ncbi:hypothetical protein V8G54_008878 [Vigna mungo]|uniref:AP180 N-terminal homology (ANTH) domain-containing protein n=1 Tax=Vigna mungo TaxID=3915 RepID=A0AAQ3SA99_VIGMU
MKKVSMKKALKLSKFSGELKGLDAAIAKATSYKHALPKEKHIRRNLTLQFLKSFSTFVMQKVTSLTSHSFMENRPPAKYSEKLDTKILLEQLPALQNLLSRLLDCRVAGESVKLYVAITIRVVELLDKFFEMYHDDARSSLRIYKKSVTQPPAFFITTMEEYIKEAPSSLMLEDNRV